MAKAAVLEFQRAGLDVEIRVDVASLEALRREASRGCDLLIYYGHGTEDGRLVFVDGAKTFEQLATTPDLIAFWQRLPACFIFACYGNQFALELPCPWLAFTVPILREAPKGLLYTLIGHLAQHSVRDAVEAALTHAANAMDSPFAHAAQVSSQPLPALHVRPGTMVLSRAAPFLSGYVEVDFQNLAIGETIYPDHEPFVGRLAELHTLWRLPAPDADRALQHVVWVHGDAGMGKSALLRQYAMVVRDLAFREVQEPVYVLHLYCSQHTRPETLADAVCQKATTLYRWESVPPSLEKLCHRLETLRGTHVWILDDLTYLSIHPDRNDEAARLIQRIVDAARGAAIPLQLVVSSRRPGPQQRDREDIRVTSLYAAEALRLARKVREQANQPGSYEDLSVGASRLFHYGGGATALYKRALLLAVEHEMSYQEYADGLEKMGSLDRLDMDVISQHMVAYELKKLGELQQRHGFMYTAFFRLYYPLVSKAGYFTPSELQKWFGEQFYSPGSPCTIAIAYKNGLTYLARLGFVLVEKDQGMPRFSMPPNQRPAMRVLSHPSTALLPTQVPLRGVQQRLSLPLERARVVGLEALPDFLAMEQDYMPYLMDPEAVQAVLYSMMVRAEIADLFGKGDESLQLLNEAVSLYDEYHHNYLPTESSASNACARALVNKGVTLGALGQPAAALAVYDEVVQRYGLREEASLMYLEVRIREERPRVSDEAHFLVFSMHDRFPNHHDRLIVRATPLSLYEDAWLLAIEDTARRGRREQFALYKPEHKIIPLNWTKEPLYWANALWGVRLDDDRAVELYCRFFFHFVRSQSGRFHIVERVDHLPWTTEVTAEHIETVAQHLRPLRILERPARHIVILSGTVLFKTALFSTKILVATRATDRLDDDTGVPIHYSVGQVELFGEELLLQELPVIDDGTRGLFG